MSDQLPDPREVQLEQAGGELGPDFGSHDGLRVIDSVLGLGNHHVLFGEQLGTSFLRSGEPGVGPPVASIELGQPALVALDGISRPSP